MNMNLFQKSLMKKELMDEIDKKVKFDLPQSLVDSELAQITNQINHDKILLNPIRIK